MLGLVRLYVDPHRKSFPQHVPVDDYQPVIDLVPEHAQHPKEDCAARATTLFRFRSDGITLDATLGGATSNSYIDMTSASSHRREHARRW